MALSSPRLARTLEPQLQSMSSLTAAPAQVVPSLLSGPSPTVSGLTSGPSQAACSLSASHLPAMPGLMRDPSQAITSLAGDLSQAGPCLMSGPAQAVPGPTACPLQTAPPASDEQPETGPSCSPGSGRAAGSLCPGGGADPSLGGTLCKVGLGHVPFGFLCGPLGRVAPEGLILASAVGCQQEKGLISLVLVGLSLSTDGKGGPSPLH